jgi:hypothetical protein
MPAQEDRRHRGAATERGMTPTVWRREAGETKPQISPTFTPSRSASRRPIDDREFVAENPLRVPQSKALSSSLRHSAR